jgi:hypothetical protein
VEYIFLAKLCSYGWSKDRFVEVARAHTDSNGYDLVLSEGDVTRHVQLKATKAGGRLSPQKINTALASKPSGCVVWLHVDANTLEPKRYMWFGSTPGERLPDLGTRVAKHVKGNAKGEKLDRAAIRELERSRFTEISTVDDVFETLFGNTG